jgi:hypothetical protein
MLECLLLINDQWIEEMSTSSMTNRDEWKWALMIMQPKEVSPRLVKVVVEPNERRTVEAQRRPGLAAVRFFPESEVS